MLSLWTPQIEYAAAGLRERIDPNLPIKTTEKETLEVETFLVDPDVLKYFIRNIFDIECSTDLVNGGLFGAKAIWAYQLYIKDIDLWTRTWTVEQFYGEFGQDGMYEHILRKVSKGNRNKYKDTKFIFCVPPKNSKLKYGLENKVYAMIPKLSDE